MQEKQNIAIILSDPLSCVQENGEHKGALRQHKGSQRTLMIYRPVSTIQTAEASYLFNDRIEGYRLS